MIVSKHMVTFARRNLVHRKPVVPFQCLFDPELPAPGRSRHRLVPALRVCLLHPVNLLPHLLRPQSGPSQVRKRARPSRHCARDVGHRHVRDAFCLLLPSCLAQHLLCVSHLDWPWLCSLHAQAQVPTARISDGQIPDVLLPRRKPFRPGGTRLASIWIRPPADDGPDILSGPGIDQLLWGGCVCSQNTGEMVSQDIRPARAKPQLDACLGADRSVGQIERAA